ncbi:helix-turn-helix transcriptional regulator [Allokutzneria sp. A3M-2-11 16]|uniref:winged helix-turn-helix transcriptional regulator n=1 Tax=Allokutzneria sp. A3M-2-11 16 TaxID=2962043 RepID=UPI0020B65B04|nr:helix-turn-helix domain-containing protein [Allokutzneria sp. A3M-2-11 16]MCP3804850.1 helix-turn-helix transcriptional regulator [Allokutzneria sp. A3M-2-11 16]
MAGTALGGAVLVLDLVRGKWSVEVLLALENGPARHGQLLRRVSGVSQKMLTQTLRELERARVVRREVGEEAVLSVEYSLTRTGESLLGLLRHVHEWALTSGPLRSGCTGPIPRRGNPTRG